MASRAPLRFSYSGCLARRTPQPHRASPSSWLRGTALTHPVRSSLVAGLRPSSGRGLVAACGRIRSFHTTRLVASADSQLFYGISAAYSGKGERLNHGRNTFELGRSKEPMGVLPTALPRHKRPRSGQDAFFASYIDSTDSVAFGVADGVGGWTDQGVDPADFAHSLCANMAEEASTYCGQSPEGMPRTQYFLEEAFMKVIEDDSVPAGGSTACLAVADPNGKVEVAK
jgi:protein phosphatase PTC7